LFYISRFGFIDRLSGREKEKCKREDRGKKKREKKKRQCAFCLSSLTGWRRQAPMVVIFISGN
jgi:hypothetical protein